MTGSLLKFEKPQVTEVWITREGCYGSRISECGWRVTTSWDTPRLFTCLISLQNYLARKDPSEYKSLELKILKMEDELSEAQQKLSDLGHSVNYSEVRDVLNWHEKFTTEVK